MNKNNKIDFQRLQKQLETNEIDFSKVEIQDRPEEYSGMYVNLLTEEQIIECLKYVDDNEDEDKEKNVNKYRLRLLETLADLDYIKAKYIGVERIYDEQPAPTNTYIVRIGRNGKSISFKFHNSYMDTLEGYTVILYDVLHCVASDGYLETDTFENFCDELGCDMDSIKSQRLYKAVKRQKEKILKIFEDVELMDFPQ